MSRTLYVDCVAGVAGDMLLGALLDAGASEAAVLDGISRLPVEGSRVERSRVERHGIGAARVDVVVPRGPAHRSWRDVRELVSAAKLPPRADRRAQDAFRRLAVAEASVHGVEPDTVTFHEVGALDAIVDICGVALALEDLDVEFVRCSPLPVSRGFTRAAHGRLPLPAPATLELLKGCPAYGVATNAELVTPTGAALVTSIAEDFGELPAIEIESVGYGAGSRELDQIPNLCRVVLGRATRDPETGAVATRRVTVLEANLDDLSPELVPDAVARCFAAGALDVWTTAAQMKKGRPGMVLAAVVPGGGERPVAEAMFRETSTLGVRMSRMERLELERSTRLVDVAGHPVRLKLGHFAGEVVNAAPEHDDCAAVAARTGCSVKAIWAAALAAGDAGGGGLG